MDGGAGIGVTLLVLGASYLVGSVPFGLLLTRLGGLGDIRKVGSGNIGATNVLRTGNKLLALLTMLSDIAKGAVAVLVVRALWPEAPELAAMAMLFVVIGHLFPVWLKFKGGKGVATTSGALLALSWPAGLLGLATWLGVAVVSRYSSLASLVACALAPLYTWYFAGMREALGVAIVAVLVWLCHHANIRRLLRGEESKIVLNTSATKQ